MSYEQTRVEIIETGGRRRRWSAAEKLRIVEESFDSEESISTVARRNGVAPNLLYRWRKLMSEGGSVAVSGNESVVGKSEIRRLEKKVHDLERLLGKKTMEVEILRASLEKADSKKRILPYASLPKGDGQ